MILDCWIQTKLKHFIPLWVFRVVFHLGSSFAIGCCWNEKLHVWIGSVPCGHEQTQTDQFRADFDWLS